MTDIVPCSPGMHGNALGTEVDQLDPFIFEQMLDMGSISQHSPQRLQIIMTQRPTVTAVTNWQCLNDMFYDSPDCLLFPQHVYPCFYDDAKDICVGSQSRTCEYLGRLSGRMEERMLLGDDAREEFLVECPKAVLTESISEED